MNSSLPERFRALRARTRQIFGLLAPEAFDRRPIPLRHPIRFYEGHLASFNREQLMRGGFVREDRDAELTELFARGIDPLSQEAAEAATIQRWPERTRVWDYIAAVDEEMTRAIDAAGVEPLFLHTAMEHEEMHQETLMYLIHRLPSELKQRPEAAAGAPAEERAGEKEWVRIEGGTVRLGLDAGAPFGWDNELPERSEEVGAFEIESGKVTNGEYLEFVEAGGYAEPRFWPGAGWEFIREEEVSAPPFWEQREREWVYRGLWETMPLPLDWPVYVSHVEASAYARWRGSRLPSEAEWQAAARVTQAPEPLRDNFDFRRWELSPAASDGGTPAQMTGNGWEWTSTPFVGFPGFQPFAHYPGYSADFFDGRHFVLKGASPVTPAALTRPSFRNWFQDQYRYAYTAFRCAR